LLRFLLPRERDFCDLIGVLSVKPSGFVALLYPGPQQRGKYGFSVFGD
jgi:hypothetical protein